MPRKRKRGPPKGTQPQNTQLPPFIRAAQPALPVTINATAYQPHKGQMVGHQSTAKTKWLQAGRRWGKGRFAIGELQETYVEALGTLAPSSLIPPFHAWVVVPTFPQGRQAWNELTHILPKEIIKGESQADWTISLYGSDLRPWGFIEVKSAHDPETLQTTGLDFLWVQECQDISETAFEKLLPTLRSPHRMGRALFEGIPATHNDHWFQRGYNAAQRGRPNHFAMHATVYDNPLLTEADIREIEGDKELLRESTWRRMYLAEFSESAGYFTNIPACIQGDLLPAPIPGVRYVGGLDLGRKVDASVLQIWDAVRRKLVYHRSWDAGQSWVVQRESVMHLSQVWELEKIVVDATAMGGDIFCEELRSHDVPVEEYIITGANRMALLNGLAVAIERETVSFPPVPSLLRQLRAFQARKQPSGAYRYESPPGEHDDEVFAGALALIACEPPEDSYSGGRLTPMRYVGHASSRANSFGQRLMRERSSARMRDRLDRAGVQLESGEGRVTS